MPRIPRRTLPDGVYHVTTRGVDGCAVFRDDADYRAFLTLLRDVATAQRWHVIAFSLMPNHVHLVLACTRRALSDGFRRLNGVHAQRFNRKYARTGHLWGDRFSSGVIASDDYLTAAVEYVLDNAVRAGLVPNRAAYRWQKCAVRADRPNLDEHTFDG